MGGAGMPGMGRAMQAGRGMGPMPTGIPPPMGGMGGMPPRMSAPGMIGPGRGG